MRRHPLSHSGTTSLSCERQASSALPCLVFGACLLAGCTGGAANSPAQQQTRATQMASGPPPKVSNAPSPWWVAEAARLAGSRDFSPPETLKDAWERLDFIAEFESEVPEIEGAVVGLGANPGRFYILAVGFLKHGTASDFCRMVTANKLYVRLMGLWCIAQADPAAAIPLLRQRLKSRQEFACFPGGCCGVNMNEGEFAWQLLHDSAYMRSHTPQPLLSKDELDKLDQEILKNPSLEHLHKTVGKHIESELARKRLGAGM